jgi:Tol biopolymer transport system component
MGAHGGPPRPAAWTRAARPRWPFAVALVAAAVSLFVWRTRPAPAELRRPVPFTADHGWESYATFSPDGQQVAYAWRPPDGPSRIYLKTIGSDSKMRLTSGAAAEGYPAWSPDGRSIAFLRFLSSNSRNALMSIATTGGQERKMTELEFPSPLSWSSDGEWLIAIDGPAKSRSIVAISVKDGATHALTKPFEFGYSGFGLSSDSRRLIFSHAGPGAAPVHELLLGPGLKPAGDPRPITEPLWILQMRVAADATQILYIDGSWEDGSLMRRRLSPGAKPEIVYTTSDRLWSPSLSPDGRRILFSTSRHGRAEIWQMSLSNPAAAPAPIISSTRSELNPQYSPDGRYIAFHSTRTGASEIWIAGHDGGNLRRLTFTNARVTATPRWSPNGEWIAFESNQSGQSDVYVIPSRGGSVRRLTDHPAVDAIPRWSRDGRFIYFCSYRTGRYEVWKIPAFGGEPRQVTANGGFVAVESPDGNYLYYSQTRNFGPVLRMPLAGGPSEELIPNISGLFFAVTERGIYYCSADAIWFWDAASRHTRRILVPPKQTDVGLDVSPDGQTLLFTQLDVESAGADLYLIDNFR